MTHQATRELIQFVCKQRYPEATKANYYRLIPLLQSRFEITNAKTGRKCVKMLVDKILWWENSHPIINLESCLNKNFNIKKI